MPQTEELQAKELADLKAIGLVPDEWAHDQMATEFRSATAGANWFACTTYPLLSFAVSRLSVQMSKPTAMAFKALKRLLRYMVSLKGKHLHYRCSEGGNIELFAQSDASLGDTLTSGRSQHAWTVSIGDRVCAIFDWKTGKCATTMVSTMSTELYALSEAARSVVGWRDFFKELNIPLPGPTTIYTDSTSALVNANHHMTNSKSRAVRLRSWYVRECVEEKEVRVVWRPGTDLHVDGLTKATLADLHQRQLREAMGM